MYKYDKKFTAGDITITVQWRDDDVWTNLPDHLGEYEHRHTPDDNYIDRKTGEVFVGGKVEKVVSAQYNIAQPRWFILSWNHIPHNPENWKHVSEGALKSITLLYGSIAGADLYYALQDWERAERWMRGEWCMMCCNVMVSVSNIEVGHADLGGIESDSTREYFDGIALELINEALEDTRRNLDTLNLITIPESVEVPA